MRVAIIGGGATGLLTGEILGRAGHEVTVVERDPAPPPQDDDSAWDSWDRPGVNQFRQPHGLLGYGLKALRGEIPEIMDSLDETDSVLVDDHRFAPEGAASEPDRPRTIMGIRRTTFDRRLGSVVESSDSVEVRRGVEVTGLTVHDGAGAHPRVSGIETADDRITADLVVDASGRRTRIPRFLTELGISHEESKESDGFTYFTRWFRSDRSLAEEPIGFGGLAPGLVALRFPSDGRTFAIAMALLVSDRPTRRLRDPEAFMRVSMAIPAVASLVENAEPTTDVIPMGSIQNRHLRLADATGPTVQGLIPVGDSALSTNPSLGRGISLALRFAIGLRDLLAERPNPSDLAHMYDRRFESEYLPWLTDSIESDNSLRRLFRAATEGKESPPPERPRDFLATAAPFDPEIWTRWGDVSHCFRTPTYATHDADLVRRASEVAAAAPPPQFTITRDELESLLAD